MRWKPEAQARGEMMYPRGQIELRKSMVFSFLPRMGDEILYQPGWALPLATVKMVTWQFCKDGMDPDEFDPFILAEPHGGDVKFPSPAVFARLFESGWKVVQYEGGLQNRLTSAADEAGLGGAIPMWESK